MSKRKLNNKQRVEFEGLLDAIAADEDAMADIDKQMEDPAIYSSADGKLAELQRRREQLELRVGAATVRWEELSELET